MLKATTLAPNISWHNLGPRSFLFFQKEIIAFDLHPASTSRTNAFNHNSDTSSIGDYGVNSTRHPAFVFNFASTKISIWRYRLLQPDIVLQ
mmetsp:Transcript_7929/g.22833  ORF Transcript_7929/g.22833 Transcript_7929/m.22833 type:complete len:91 (+) Transcript_7929:1499-1771(+)